MCSIIKVSIKIVLYYYCWHCWADESILTRKLRCVYPHPPRLVDFFVGHYSDPISYWYWVIVSPISQLSYYFCIGNELRISLIYTDSDLRVGDITDEDIN